jgi:protein-L-isoaspartate(D-aspartate) O-methyltransferase
MTSQRTRTRMIERLREQGIVDEDVLAAIAAVPRHVFVEEALASRAYEDTALPLGFSQTISQPYVVARMIEALIGGRVNSAGRWRSAPAAATRRRCWRS